MNTTNNYYNQSHPANLTSETENNASLIYSSVAGFSHSRIHTLMRHFTVLLPSFGFPARERQRCVGQGVCFPVLQQRTVYYYPLSKRNHFKALNATVLLDGQCMDSLINQEVT